jgi:lactoylglutathione lyase
MFPVKRIRGEEAMFKRIAHVCLYTKDLNKSIAFYSKLGATEKFRFTRNGADFGVYLELAPGSFIEIFEQGNSGPAGSGGVAHFCLETESLDAVTKRLETAGIPFTPAKLGCDGTWQIWLTDPDGATFEVHQYTSNSMQLAGGGRVEADW